MFCSALLGISTLLFCFHEFVDFKFYIESHRVNDLIVNLFKFTVRFNIVDINMPLCTLLAYFILL